MDLEKIEKDRNESFEKAVLKELPEFIIKDDKTFKVKTRVSGSSLEIGYFLFENGELQSAPGETIIGEVPNEAEAIKAAKNHFQLVHLEDLTLEDREGIEAVFRLRSHPDVDKNLLGTPPASLEDHIKWLDGNLNIKRSMYLIKQYKTIVGYCHWSYSITPTKHKEVGWVIDPQYQNKGFGKSAIKLLTEKVTGYGFVPTLNVLASNTKAGNMYLKAGYKIKNKENDLLEMVFVGDKNE